MRKKKVVTLGVIGVAVLAIVGLCALCDRRQAFMVRKLVKRNGIEGLVPCNLRKFSLLKEHNDRMKKGRLTDEEWQDVKNDIPLYSPAYDQDLDPV